MMTTTRPRCSGRWLRRRPDWRKPCCDWSLWFSVSYGRRLWTADTGAAEMDDLTRRRGQAGLARRVLPVIPSDPGLGSLAGLSRDGHPALKNPKDRDGSKHV